MSTRHLHGRTRLWDGAALLPAEVVGAAREYAQRQVREIERLIFPILGVH